MEILYKILACAAGIFVAIFATKRWGASSEKAKALKKELERTQKEQEYERKVNCAVNDMSNSDQRKWLQDHAHK